MTDTLDLRLPNDLSEIATLAERIEEFLGALDLPPKLAFEVNLALDELLTNVISYAFPPGARREISVRVSIDNDGVLNAEVEDDGVAFDPFSDAGAPVLEGEVEDRPIGGLGVHFVRTLMDDVHYSRRGEHNYVRLTKRAR